MRICISVPMNYYLKCEVIYNTSKIDLYSEYKQTYQILSTEIVQIHEQSIQKSLMKIIDKLKSAFPSATTYRLYQDHHMYVEEVL